MTQSQKSAAVRVGELARLVRRIRGRTLAQVGRSVGFSPATLYRLERGRVVRPPTPERLRALAAALDTSVVPLLRAAGYRDDAAARKGVPRAQPQP